MRKIGFKALSTLLAASRGSNRRVVPALATAIFSTIIVLGLLAVYLWQKLAGFP